MTNRKTDDTATPLIDVLIERAMEAIDGLEAWVKDSSDAAACLRMMDEAKGLIDAVKVVLALAETSVKRMIAQADDHVLFLPDGRTVTQGTEPKRTMHANARDVIRRRVVNKALSVAQGDVEVALLKVAEMTEDLYVSPSAEPKATPLKALGFTWAELSDSEEIAKGLAIK